MDPVVSVVIRTFNEAESLRKVLSLLRAQRYPAPNRIELIVVDNQSSDGTPEVAREFGAQVVTLERERFSYPRSMNSGVAVAHAPIVVLMVGHAYPGSEYWLQAALCHFKTLKVAGVYGPCIPHDQHSFAEWCMYMPGYWRSLLQGPKAITEVGSGVFGATNCALRRSLWEIHPFDERYELGGEDTEWAEWATQKTYSLVCDPRFAVQHSHHLGWMGVMKQVLYWRKLRRPTTFSKEALNFRKDIHW